MVSSETYNERIALWLDGEPIELTAEERRIADEILRDQAVLDTAIDPRPRQEAMAHARWRLSGELARPTRRKRWLGALTVVEAAAVAALMIVTWTVHMVANGSSADLLDVYVQASAEVRTIDELDILQDELNTIQAALTTEMLGGEYDREELEIESLQQQLEDYDLYESFDDWIGG